MNAAVKGRHFLRFAAAAMVLAVALAPAVCAEAHPEMHAGPAGHSRSADHSESAERSGPPSSPGGHDDCLWQTARADSSALGQPLFSSLAVIEAPRPLDFRAASDHLVSPREVQAPLIFFSPFHERAPPRITTS